MMGWSSDQVTGGEHTVKERGENKVPQRNGNASGAMAGSEDLPAKHAKDAKIRTLLRPQRGRCGSKLALLVERDYWQIGGGEVVVRPFTGFGPSDGDMLKGAR